MRLPISEYTNLNVLSRIVSELSWAIGQIIAFDRGYLCSTHSFGVNPQNSLFS